MLILLLIALLGSCLFPLAARIIGRGAGFVVALLPFGLLAGLVALAPIVERGWVRGEGWQWAPSLGLDLTLRLDGFSFLFCLLITGIGGLVTIYAGGYLTNKSRRDRARFFTLILLFMTAMLGTVLADNLLLMILFWEATSILSFLLIGFDHKSSRSRRAAILSLQVTAIGGLGLVVAAVMIGHVTGTYSMAEAVRRGDEIVAHPLGVPILLGIMLAAFTKSAQFPFHFWLPNAMQAPTPASAYLHSATMVKLGIYLLARFEPVIAMTEWGRGTLVAVACLTMIVAAVQALRAESFKAALAYSTIASLGILVLLVGLDGPRASVAMIGFLFAHALYKAALFFCAGSVLHATGKGVLRSLGGLRKPLPLTAAACVGASLSMAGIPPFLGFISKEFLFEAQLASSWELVPLAIAVLVNAVMVGVAGVITLRPFFMKPAQPVEMLHGESFSLVLPPLLLATMGLTISLDPEWITRVAIRPAVIEVYGQTVAVDLSVWHGLTPMLALSAVVVSIGILIIRFWRRIHLLLRSRERIERYSVESLWEKSLFRLVQGGARLTRWIEHGDLRGYVATAIVAFTFFLVWAFVASGAEIRVPAIEGPVRYAEILVGLMAVAGAIVAAASRNLLAALVGVGITGFAIAITFLFNGAPDLALTQFTVEALLVVLLTALLLALPLAGAATRSRSEHGRDLLIAGAFGIVLFAALIDMGAGRTASEASDWFGRMSYIAGHGANVVNVILVDFRAFDTMGETAVIAIAAVLAGSLLARRRGAARDAEEARTVHFAFSAASRPLFWMLIAASVIILFRGHNQPGGGFVGGLAAALAFAVLSLAHGAARAEKALRLQPLTLVGIGLALGVASGLPGMFVPGGAPFLTHLWWEPGGMLPKLGTTMIFDIGVYLVVLGAVLSFLFGLQKEGAR
ncbi:hydrogen gas-evolving membrane-bound hydrogenase subunit E [Allosphingosinicella indica]|uniref:Multisubunit sodium/proton antiporter, MrpA subunit n=1 Tax=Allosphingosinicella indica TaxID=941907 RepID=A0A1X7GD61_9SPHN|nr:hydrogen gas-evolving membrane-bound hydrogenase subunit E [Allosphingosinicella indica]SMF67858.1 multisubunit sodium/proton antiporter, MrpA subunit [Allosphingosinicella indica]